MKIAFLNIYGGKVYRGAERSVEELAKRLNTNHEVTVFQSGRPSHLSYFVKSFGEIPVIPTDVSLSYLLRILKKLYLDPYSLLVLYFSLRCFPYLMKQNFDIIIPINGFWQVFLCKLIKSIHGSKIIVLGFAGIGVDDYINLKLSPDAFFPMTAQAAKWAKKINPHIDIEIVPGGVDTKIITPQVTPMKLPLSHPIVLTVAALVPYKRVDLVIKAISKLPNVSLVIAGNGPLKNDIEKLADNLLPNRYVRLDITFDQLPALYTACNAFTLPSEHQSSLFSHLTGQLGGEAFGIVYVEAMSAGLPVIAPADDLRREIIGDAGTLVDCTNIDLYAKALKKTLEINWENLPRKRAELFDWKTIAHRFEQLLVVIKQKK